MIRQWRAFQGYRRLGSRSKAEIAQYQFACLQDLLRHAYDRVPYYRRRFDAAGVRPSDIRSVADLHLLPATSRDDMQFLPPHDICAEGVRINTLRSVTTSGSTGAPLTVWRTKAEEQLLLALRARLRRVSIWLTLPACRDRSFGPGHAARQGPPGPA
jgi:phenylacetate-coenzyme A ligase PaaK-like adenylate-forming protein